MKPLRTGQIAQMCGVAPRTVTKWIDTGYLKGYRIPGSADRRVNAADFVAFLKQHNMPVPAEIKLDIDCLYVGRASLECEANITYVSSIAETISQIIFASYDVVVIDHQVTGTAVGRALGLLLQQIDGFLCIIHLINEDDAGLYDTITLQHPVNPEVLAQAIIARRKS